MAANPDRRPADPAVPTWLVRWAAVGARLLVLAVLVWLLAELAAKLTLLLVTLLVALLLAGAFAPLVQWADARGAPRWVAAGLPVLLLLVVIGAATAAIGARLTSEAPQLRTQVEQASTELSRTLGIDIPVPGTGGADGGGSGSPAAVDGVLGSAQVLVEVLFGFFLTLAFTFLFLKDGPTMWRWVLGKLAGRRREDVDAGGRAAWGTVGGYVRGLTIVALFDATGIGLGLLLLGVPLAFTLAALQFLASYIPTIGAFVAGAVAVAVAYASSGPGTAALVLALVVLVQQIGNDVIEPYVMGRRLPLDPAVVLITVTAGGLLWGIAGALLFLPLAAAVSAAAHELWVRHGSRPIVGE